MQAQAQANAVDAAARQAAVAVAADAHAHGSFAGSKQATNDDTYGFSPDEQPGAHGTQGRYPSYKDGAYGGAEGEDPFYQESEAEEALDDSLPLLASPKSSARQGRQDDHKGYKSDYVVDDRSRARLENRVPGGYAVGGDNSARGRKAPHALATPVCTPRRATGDVDIGVLPSPVRRTHPANSYVTEPGSIVTVPPANPTPRANQPAAVAASEEGGEGGQLQLDMQAYIKPEAYAHLWEVLQTSAEFKCRVQALYSAVSVDSLVAHLNKRGFCVVSTGAPVDTSPVKRHGYEVQSLSGFKVFVFASGYETTHSGASTPPFFCLMQLVVKKDLTGAAEAEGESPVFKLACTVRCTQRHRSSTFIAELQMGDIFKLL